MNSCCTQFYTIPQTNEKPVDILSLVSCVDRCDCNCGYILYESLAPHMSKLTNEYTKNEDHIALEAKLRQQIIEVSRLFDLETSSRPGEHSSAHYKILKLYGNGSKYLKIPEFVDGTLQLYTADNYLINPDSYAYIDGFLVLNPCVDHSSSCGCTDGCGSYSSTVLTPGWTGCLQAYAKFGKECADQAIQLAIKLYIIELNSYGEVKETNFQGLPIARGFKLPHAWESTIKNYKDKKRAYNTFAFA